MAVISRLIEAVCGVSNEEKRRRAELQQQKAQEELKRKADQLQDHQQPLQELLDHLGSDPAKGLSSSLAQHRLEQEGRNVLTPPKTSPWWWHFIQHMTTGFALMLWAGAVLCFVVYALQGTAPDLSLGIVLAVVNFISGAFSFYQESKSEALLASFAKLTPTMSLVVRDGKPPQEMNAAELVRGDVIELRGGFKVPADCRILDSKGLKVDNSSLTGESLPLKRTAECTSPSAFETKNMAFFGTNCTEGSATALVVRTGDGTAMGEIAKAALQVPKPETLMKKELKRFVLIIGSIAVALGVVFGIIAGSIGYSATETVVFVIAIIVANVPEGLMPTVTVALAITAKNMASKHVLVKNVETIETLGSVTVICSDKTGTLTQNRMTVRHAVYNNSVNKVLHPHISTPPRSHRASLMSCEPSPEPVDVAKRNSIPDADPPQGADRGHQASALSSRAVSVSMQEITHEVLQRIGSVELAELVHSEGAAADRAADKRAAIQEVSHPQIHSVGPAPVDDAISRQFGLGGAGVTYALEYVLLLRCCTLCNHARFVSKGANILQRPTSGDASESALLKMAASHLDVDRFRVENPEVACLAFNSTNKYMVTIHKQPNGRFLVIMKGAPERVLDRCSKVANGPLFDAQQRKELERLNLELANNGERVLAFAQLELDPRAFPSGFVFDIDEPNFPTTGLELVGLLSLEDPPRSEVPDAVAECQRAGIQVVMVTGDHPLTAKSIAHQIGILPVDGTVTNVTEQNPNANGVVVSGPEVDGLTEEAWDFILTRKYIVFARTLPTQKQTIVKQFQQRGHVVAVTGDGVNDSPALKVAQVGIAMGSGSDVAKDAADMVLTDDNFASIVKGVEEGRLIFDNLKKSIQYTLESNIPEIYPFLLNIVLRIPLSLTTIMILCIDLGTDMLPAIAFAYEPPEADIMLRKPRDLKTDKLVTWQLITLSYVFVGHFQAIGAFIAFFYTLWTFGFAPADVFRDQNGIFWDMETDGDGNKVCQTWTNPATGQLEPCAPLENRVHALHVAQSAHFVATVLGQVGGGIKSKTRFLPVFKHWAATGGNLLLSIGYFQEILLCAVLVYVPGINTVFGFRPMEWYHWWPGIPVGIVIVLFDEYRKWLVRNHPKCWLARITNY